MTELKWEDVPSDKFRIWRAAVPGGWLVWVATPGNQNMTFVPDLDHKW